MKKIITRCDPPPIPPRQFDWTAVTDNYDLGSPIGYGRTEAEAISDLRDQLDDEDEEPYQPPFHCAVYVGRGKLHCADMGLRQCRECAEEEKRS